MHKEIFYSKKKIIIFDKMIATLTAPFMSIYMSVCLSVCPYWFPNHIQPEANVHFNTLRFSTHKEVIILRGYLISTAYWHFLL